MSQLTIPATPAASMVNATDQVWIWQSGQLLRTTVGAMIAASSAANLTINSNISGAPASNTANTLSAILDAVLGSAAGTVLVRGASGWTAASAGTAGQLLTANTGAAPSFQTLAALLSSLPAMADGTVLSNISGGSASPAANSIAGVIDKIGSTRGAILYRGISGWTILTPGTAGQALTSGGAGNDPSYTTLPGSGTVTSVGISGGSTGLTFSSSPITVSGTMTASGTLSVANGGTGQTTVNGAQIALGLGFLTKQNVTANSTTLAIDASQGTDIALTLSSNVSTFTISNWPAAGTLGRMLLEIASTGSYNITGWPGTAIWNLGSAPTITTSGKDTILLTSNDGGANYRGYIVAQAMA